MNTWPKGYRHSMSQPDHGKWNAKNYPGTRQLCSICEDPTGFCEEDGIYNNEGNPLCVECAFKSVINEDEL